MPINDDEHTQAPKPYKTGCTRKKPTNFHCILNVMRIEYRYVKCWLPAGLTNGYCESIKLKSLVARMLFDFAIINDFDWFEREKKRWNQTWSQCIDKQSENFYLPATIAFITASGVNESKYKLHSDRPRTILGVYAWYDTHYILNVMNIEYFIIGHQYPVLYLPM